MRTKIYIGLFLLLLLAATAVHNLRTCLLASKHCSYSAVMPKAGDYAIISLRTVKQKNIDLSKFQPSGSQYTELKIECNRVSGLTCRFKVCYADRGRSAKPLYFVVVNYATNDLDKRTKIVMPSGRTIARGQLVDGNSVPFQVFLVFDEAYLGKAETKELWREDGLEEVLTRHDYGNLGWVMIYRLGSRKEIQEHQHQSWTSGEWLWQQCQGFESGRTWWAERKSITGVMNN